MKQNDGNDADPAPEGRSRLMHGLIDEGVWEDLRVLQMWSEPDMLTKVMTSYIAGSSKFLDERNDMSSGGNTTSLRDAACRLSYTSAGLGAMALASLCRELAGLEQGVFDARAADVLMWIQEEFSRVKVSLEIDLRARKE
jgi:hypothetical protein